MKLTTTLQVFSFIATSFGDAFCPSGLVQKPRSVPMANPSATTISRQMIGPETTDLLLAEKDYSEVPKTVAIALVLGGGLVPATIAANKAMFKTLSGRKDEEEEEEDLEKSSSSLDPTISEKRYRKYVSDSGAQGPDLPSASLLFAADRIPLSDVVAVLGRIKDKNSIADWGNLPSAKLPNVSAKNPPMWLPRKAFKVNIRKAKFLGWPTDPKTGLPLGGQELKEAEMARISKKDVEIVSFSA